MQGGVITAEHAHGTVKWMLRRWETVNAYTVGSVLQYATVMRCLLNQTKLHCHKKINKNGVFRL